MYSPPKNTANSKKFTPSHLKEKKRHEHKSLHQLANIEMVKDRLYKLCKSYFKKCIIKENPLLLDCFKEYLKGTQMVEF
jgi:hypothetical protein